MHCLKTNLVAYEIQVQFIIDQYYIIEDYVNDKLQKKKISLVQLQW